VPVSPEVLLRRLAKVPAIALRAGPRLLARAALFGQSRALAYPQGSFARVNILRLVLLGLAALCWIAAGSGFLQQRTRLQDSLWRPAALAGKPWPLSNHQLAVAGRDIEEKLKSAPEYVSLFTRLQSAFPPEYGIFLAGFAHRSAAGGETGGVDLLASQAMRALRFSRGVLAAKAGPAALEHVFELQLAVMRALAAFDPHLCAHFLFGAEGIRFLDFAASHRALIAEFAIAGIEAIEDGQRRQIAREAPTAADFGALEEALRAKGLSTAEIDAVLDAKTSSPAIDDGRMCEAGQVYLETLAAIPQEQRLRIYSFAAGLMARS